MNNLEDRFDKQIETEKFSFLEMTGFKAKPHLAIKVGMGIGYKMALADNASQPSPQCSVEMKITEDGAPTPQ